MSPVSIRWPPNHSTATLVAFAMSITSGNSRALMRPTCNAVSVSSPLATSNRSRSVGSRTNARTTRIPVICSRRIRLTASMRTCITRKAGTIRAIRTNMVIARTGTAATSTSDVPTSSRSAMTMPPMPMIGAITTMVQLISTSICTCCTSLVLRVMSDGAPNRPNSRAENSPTRRSTASRTSRPTAMAVRAAKYTEPIEQPICTELIASITAPVVRM